MNKITKYLQKVTGLDADEKFLNELKGDWNRLCNSYVDEANIQTGAAKKKGWGDEPYLPQMVEIGKKYLRLHGIFSKQKILPDPKFSQATDEGYRVTLAKMHDFISSNPYPTTKSLDPDAAYDIRWRGIMLIDYLTDLSRKPYRYISVSVVRLSIYLLIPIGLISSILFLLKSIFEL